MMKIFLFIFGICIGVGLAGTAGTYDVQVQGWNITSDEIEINMDPDNYSYKFSESINQTILKYSASYSNGEESTGNSEGDVCDVDLSTETGTISAIILASLGVDNCPIAPGSRSSKPRFQVNGNLPPSIHGSQSESYTKIDLTIYNSETTEPIGNTNYLIFV